MSRYLLHTNAVISLLAGNGSLNGLTVDASTLNCRKSRHARGVDLLLTQTV